MFELPTSIKLDGVDYPIRNKGDFRMVLDCFSALNDVELDEQYRILTCLIIFYDGVKSESDLSILFKNNIQNAVIKMFEFFSCGRPSNETTKQKHQLVNWEKDEQMIASAVNSVAKQEIRLLPYLHWWTFMGYYNSIGECTFSTIVSIRNKIKKGKKLEAYEKEFKSENPEYFNWETKSAEDTQIETAIMNLWNSGGT